ncbi:hypothetical protein [Microbacterium testaceum]|uniref:hypothetical protein n=1 Tax=Microbacterium testaceum TaxID=2033 RepID=UPI0027D86BD2|nr:hypothetical protein [Microbacterium testaceum]
MLGALRGDRRDVIRRIIGVVVLIAATVIAARSASGMADADTVAVAVVTVLAGSAVTLGFAVGPPVTASVDPLDPRRFAVVGPEPRPLAGALLLAGFLSVPVLVVLVLGISLAISWGAHGANALASIVSVVLGLATCVLFARVSMALGALVQRPRQSRELMSVYLVAILVVVVPVGVFLGSLEWRGAVPSQLASAAEILAWTPIGAAWGIALAPSAGAPPSAASSSPCSPWRCSRSPGSPSSTSCSPPRDDRSPCASAEASVGSPCSPEPPEAPSPPAACRTGCATAATSSTS